ncbi:nitrate reductase; clathrin interactor [Trichuris trichiura]|uniref:Nitrate reductase clathrin interactor n=1 Tax=Trichuris trichiura TaxID=36087 RepID=A0A077ZLV9_TRITR|nr:nitrate reductase; clathrin interactor [Trichuris trichiura]
MANVIFSSNNECCDRKKQQEFTFPCSDSDTVGQFDPRSSEHDFADSSSRHVLTKNASTFGSAAQIPRLPSPPTISTNVKTSGFQEVTSVSGPKLLVEVCDAPAAKIGTSDWPGEKVGSSIGIDEFSNFVSSSKAPEPDEKNFDIGAACVDFTSFAGCDASSQEMKQHTFPVDPMTPTCLQSSKAFESNAGVLSDPFDFGSICSLPSQVPCIPVATETTSTLKPPERKLPDTWSDIHKIGLDLNCLSLENKPRKQNALSMNELQEQNRQKMQRVNQSSPLPSSNQCVNTVNHGTPGSGLDLLS